MSTDPQSPQAGPPDRPPLSEADAERILAYVEGRLDADARERLEHEILANDTLAAALYAEINLRGAFRATTAHQVEVTASAAPRPMRATPSRSLRSRRSILQPRVLLPLAAALALLIVLPRLLSSPRRHAPVLRGAVVVPTGVEGRGELSAPPQRFTWTAAAPARSYRFQLFDPMGKLLFQTTVTDTTLALPDGAVAWAGIERGYWIVIPIADGTDQPASRPIRFEIQSH